MSCQYRPIARLCGVIWGVLLVSSLSAADPASPYFAIEVLDAETGRGVPLVELRTTSQVCYYTDSQGLAAFQEPGLMDRKVWFGVLAHGYEFPADGFGARGVTLETKPGGWAQVKIRRINVAERLYRITGQGIYRDTVLLGRKPPIDQPLLNAQVTGQDSVLAAVYRNKLYWFYGDTNRLGYVLGNFAATGATSALPENIDPAVGFNLNYFTGNDGFVRPMAPRKGEGVVWLSGLVVLADSSGRQHMFAWFQRRRGLGAVLEQGFVRYDDQQERFESLVTLSGDPQLVPQGFAFPVRQDGVEYVYFMTQYPALRVRANRESYLDLAQYEAYTCLKSGTRYEDARQAELDRDAADRLVWSWKRNTAPVSPQQQRELVAAGRLAREESPFRLQDAETGKSILLHNGSCCWNEYRRRYVLIASESHGATMLGEVWYSEAERPEGPWVAAVKIITHANKPGDPQDFYNPVQHPFFDREGGRVIYLEGTYTHTFSGNAHATPYYDYNQIMYRLDLSDPRLKRAQGKDNREQTSTRIAVPIMRLGDGGRRAP